MPLDLIPLMNPTGVSAAIAISMAGINPVGRSFTFGAYDTHSF
jgi:hypothetical protein